MSEDQEEKLEASGWDYFLGLLMILGFFAYILFCGLIFTPPNP